MTGPSGLQIPANAPTIGAIPKVKVILVKQGVDELEGLIQKGWKIASTFPHAQGALFLLMKD